MRSCRLHFETSSSAKSFLLQFFKRMFETEQSYDDIIVAGDKKFIKGSQMKFSKSQNPEIKLLNNRKMNTNKMPVSMTFLTARAQAFGHSVSDQV